VCEILCKLQRYCAGNQITLLCVMLLDWQNIMRAECYYYSCLYVSVYILIYRLPCWKVHD
jgi:hypothetical protein